LRGISPLLVLVLCAGCTSSKELGTDTSAIDETPTTTEPAPEVWVDLPVSEGTHLTEVVGTCTAAAVARPYEVACVQDGRALWFDPTQSAPLDLGPASEVAAVSVDGVPWVRLDDALVALHDGVPVPLDLGLPVPVTHLQQAGGSIWLSGAGRLFEVRGRTVHEVKLEGVSAITAFAASSRTLYVATPELVILSRDAEGLSVDQAWPHPVSHLAITEDDVLWALVDGVPHVRADDHAPLPVALSEPIHALHGPHIWMVADSGLFHVDGRSLTHHPMDTTGTLAVDDLGRVLQLSGDTLVRHAVGRPVAVVGLPDVLEVRLDVQLLPTDPDSLTGLSAWVNDQSLPVDPVTSQATLDPDLLPEGEGELRIFTESPLGDHLDVHPIFVGGLPDVTWEQVDVINQASCVACHGGDTATRLETADDWRIHIHTILELVNSGEMPLGGPPLSEDDIVTIRAWQHGGFQ